MRQNGSNGADHRGRGTRSKARSHQRRTRPNALCYRMRPCRASYGWLDRLLLRSEGPRALSDLRTPMRFRMARPNAVQPFYALIGKGSETGLAAPTTSIVPEIVPPDSISISP